jgi:uncharacterized protein (DUF885 family)
MRLLILAATAAMLAMPFAAVAQSTPAPAVRAPQNAALAELLNDFEAYLRQVDPVSAGREGDEAAQARMYDASRTFELAQRVPLSAFLARLQAINPAGLSPAEQIDRSFLIGSLEHELAEIELDVGRLSFDSEGGPGATLSYLGGSTRLDSVAAAERWLLRIEAMARLYDQAIANARRGLATGMTQSRSVVESALVAARADAALSIEDEPLSKPFDTLPATVSAADSASLRAQAGALLGAEIEGRRQAWLTFLETEYLPAAPVEPGLVHRPGGRAIYAHAVKGYTTTDMTPDEVHALGLAEVARIRARMDIEMRAAGWTGDFAGFLAHLRTDPRYYSQSREDLLEKASEMAKRADDGLPALFATLPRLTYGVRPVPAEIEANYTTGRYNGGSLKNGVAGGYMVNTSRLDQRPLYELPALTLHEAVPGHHLQIALQQEAGDQPYFRRQADVTAFTEGWGLYAEFLGEEMGFYRTPHERFGRLSYEMWRACRLVADTGLHWLGWTTEQARACFRDNSALAPHNIETELQRYIGWPGQATAYKIGEIRLRAIRARAEAALGDRFDIRTFHDALLTEGPLPLALLDQRMDRWIAEQGR